MVLVVWVVSRDVAVSFEAVADIFTLGLRRYLLLFISQISFTPGLCR